jgi:hypothetical protein
MRSPVIPFLSAVVTAVAVSVSVAPTVSAAPNIENAEDERFMVLLDHSGVLTSFNLQKRQGQRYCRDVIGGEKPLEAIQDLRDSGDYSFDVANGIASAAGTVYCLCANYTALIGKPSNGPCSGFETAYRNGDIP